jgi:hypothetical protein
VVIYDNNVTLVALALPVSVTLLLAAGQTAVPTTLDAEESPKDGRERASKPI